MPKTGLLTIVILAACQVACANYAGVASVNRDNLAALERMEKQLDKKAADGIYEAAAKNSGSIALALSRAAASQAELERTFGVKKDECGKDPRCRIVLNNRLSIIELDYRAKRDESLQKADDLNKLHIEFSKAFAALRKNGEDIQKYLELSWFKRLFQDVKGMDSEQIKKIGEDLKTISARLGGSEQ